MPTAVLITESIRSSPFKIAFQPCLVSHTQHRKTELMDSQSTLLQTILRRTNSESRLFQRASGVGDASLFDRISFENNAVSMSMEADIEISLEIW